MSFSVQKNLVVALSVDPVSKPTVVTSAVFLNEFVGTISKDVVWQGFEPLSFGVGGTVGVVLTGFVVDGLKLVVGDCIDECLTMPFFEFFPDLLPSSPFSKETASCILVKL